MIIGSFSIRGRTSGRDFHSTVADVDYDNFDDTTKARYDKFVEAWYKKQDEMATEQANAAAVV